MIVSGYAESQDLSEEATRTETQTQTRVVDETQAETLREDRQES